MSLGGTVSSLRVCLCLWIAAGVVSGCDGRISDAETRDSGPNTRDDGGTDGPDPVVDAEVPLDADLPRDAGEDAAADAGDFGRCGDGMRSDSEECDDGNTVAEGCAYDARSCMVCDATCKLVAGSTSYCGDTSIDVAHGEECDDGNSDAGDGCDPDCKVEVLVTCGNGVLDPGEQCDDSDTDNLDGCNAACRKEIGWNCDTVGSACTSVCGDGHKVGAEACDDGNTSTEACPYGETSCTVCNASCENEAGATSYCGDGIVQAAAGEACDAQNDQRCSACDIVCDTLFITYSTKGVFEITGTTFGAGDGKHPQTGGKIIAAVPAGPAGPLAGGAGLTFMYSPVKATTNISVLSTKIVTDLVGTAGTENNRCLLNSGTLNAATRALTWDTCPYTGGNDWTPQQQQVSAGSGPGCVPYDSQGTITCTGNGCGTAGLSPGANNVDDSWDQPLSTYEFGENYTTVKGQGKVEIPNTTSGRTWISFDGTEVSRTCGFKASGCPTPGAQ